MKKLIRWAGPLMLTGLVTVAPVSAEPEKAGTAARANPDALVLADFQKRIDEYVKLHDSVAKGSAEMKETSDPAKIRLAQSALAARIQAARKDARPGDI